MAKRPYAAHDVQLRAGHSLRYYEWNGTGTNLVLLHGSGSYGLQWEWVADHLSDRFHVFALDQRGHGDSGRPDGEYSAEEYAEDVYQFVDTLGLGQIEHNMVRVRDGYRMKYDPVRVAQGLTHMATDLRRYASRVDCPVLVMRSATGSELSADRAAELAALWKQGRAVDVEGGYMLHIQNPAGVAEAITTFVDSVAGINVSV